MNLPFGHILSLSLMYVIFQYLQLLMKKKHNSQSLSLSLFIESACTRVQTNEEGAEGKGEIES